MPANANRSSKAVLNSGMASDTASDPQQFLARLHSSFLALKTIGFGYGGQRVDYSAIASSEEYAEFKQTVAPQLAKLRLDTFQSREKLLAFWINLYNVLTLDAVVAFEIKTSVTEGFLGLLRFFRQAAYRVDGQRYSLEAIEHGILRANRGHPYIPGPQFRGNDKRRKNVIHPFEPRIHFALNCASKSCPPIAFYEADLLNQQLELATRNFVDQECRLDEESKAFRVSRIFGWYAKDFGGQTGVREFIMRHLPQDDPRRAYLEADERARIRYLPYNWALNT